MIGIIDDEKIDILKHRIYDNLPEYLDRRIHILSPNEIVMKDSTYEDVIKIAINRNPDSVIPTPVGPSIALSMTIFYIDNSDLLLVYIEVPDNDSGGFFHKVVIPDWVFNLEDVTIH